MSEPIPRILHFIWLKDSMHQRGVPDWIQKNIDSFCEYHPDWSVRVHDDLPNDMPEDLRRGCMNAPMATDVSNLLRYWLLYRDGGIYLDADNFCVRNFEPLRQYDFFFCGEPKCVYGGVMGCIPQSPYIKRIIDAVSPIVDVPCPRTTWGPKILTSLYRDGKLPGATMLPMNYFYWLRSKFVAPKVPGGTRSASLAFSQMDHDEQEEWMSRASADFKRVPGCRPFSVHLWQSPGSKSHNPLSEGKW